MDLKERGQRARASWASTRDELGGSLWAEVQAQAGGGAGRRPRAGPALCSGPVHQAIGRGLVRSCHDLSEGGLAVALAEMAFAGGLGAAVVAPRRPVRGRRRADDLVLLFSESPTRFLLEVPPRALAAAGRPRRAACPGPARRGDRRPGEAHAGPAGSASLGSTARPSIDASIGDLKAAWQRPLRW